MIKVIKQNIKIIFCCLVALLLPQYIYAASITLAWDASEPGSADVAGYKIYYGRESGNYDLPVIDAGNVTSYTVNDLDEKGKYYFAVTAYASGGEESMFSEELSTFSEFAATATINAPVVAIDPCGEKKETGGIGQLTFNFLSAQINFMFEPEDARLSCNPCTIIQQDNSTIRAVKKGPLGIITLETFIFEGLGNVALKDQVAINGTVTVYYTLFNQLFNLDCPWYVIKMEAVKTGF
ncbi:MAG: fibronectin type III domain-containing protein [Pseudomonadota bacterium]